MQNNELELNLQFGVNMKLIEDECLVQTSVSMEYPPVALSLGEKLLKSHKGDQLVPIPLGTYGNFSFVQAPPKTKKTFFISLLASVYLSGKNNLKKGLLSISVISFLNIFVTPFTTTSLLVIV